VHSNFGAQNRLRDQAIFLTLIWTGLRISDVVTLTYEHFISNGNWVDVLAVKEKKNKKKREIEFSGKFCEFIKSYILAGLNDGFKMTTDYIFIKPNNEPLKPASFIPLIKGACRRSGLSMVTRTRGTHCGRGTFAKDNLTMMVSDGMPIEQAFQTLCDSMNHGDTKTTMSYVGYNKQKVKEYTNKHTARTLI
jgi:site-specific recombinase XerD